MKTIEKQFIEDLSSLNNDAKQKLDVVISNMKNYKDFMGYGASGSGTITELLFANFISQHMNGWYAVRLGLANNSYCGFDILISRNDKILNKEIIMNLIKKCFNLDDLEKELTKIVGDFIGLSLKSYNNDASQISTSSKIREICETAIPDFGVCKKEDLLKDVLNKIEKELSGEFTMFINFSNDEYSLYYFDLSQFKIDEIEFKQLKKHTRYFLKRDGENLMDVKYGANQANPYQRGLWTGKIRNFPTIFRRKYATVDGDIESKLTEIFKK